MVGILTPQLEPTLGLTTPIPTLRSPTLQPFIQAEQAEQEEQVELEEQVEQVGRAEQAARAEQVARAAQAARVVREALVQLVRQEKEAEQVAEVLFS
jgi:hypothetical protein